MMAKLFSAVVLSRLANVRARDLTPKVEVVLSHYAEDMEWVKDYRERPDLKFTIYSKNENPPADATEVLPNIGREGHTYLSHIVRNYDDLAAWTVFSQAAAPGWGHEFGNHNCGHLSDGVQFEDYLKPNQNGKDSFFVMTAASSFPDGAQSTRLGIMQQNLKTEGKPSICPAAEADGWAPWWWHADHPHIQGRKPEFLDFYGKYISEEQEVKPFVALFSAGGRFAVSRERIRARPRSYYVRLLEAIPPSTDPVEGFWIEAAWYDIFHPEAMQSRVPICQLPSRPASGRPLMLGAPEWMMAIEEKVAAAGGVIMRRAQGTYGAYGTYGTYGTYSGTYGTYSGTYVNGTVTFGLVWSEYLTVANATAFRNDPNVPPALRASFVGLNPTLKTADQNGQLNIVITFQQMRRLEATARFLVVSTPSYAGSLQVTYTVTATVSAQTAASLNAAAVSLGSLTNAQLAAALNAALAAQNPSSPWTISVLGATVPVVTNNGVAVTVTTTTASPDSRSGAASFSMMQPFAALAACMFLLQIV